MKNGTVVMCAHNEEHYIKDCLNSILNQTRLPDLVIVVADRCRDDTVNVAKQQLKSQRSIVVEKQTAHWKNSISENLQLSLNYATGDFLAVVDADMTLPSRFLERILSELDGFSVVSALVRTDPSKGILNRLVAFWELTYVITPLGEQPRGGARVISMRALKAVGGFRDVYAWESDLDTRLRRAGFRLKLDRSVSVLHRRRMTLSHSITYQVQAGRARKELHVSPFRTLLHSIVRLRPFVMVGYLGHQS